MPNKQIRLALNQRKTKMRKYASPVFQHRHYALIAKVMAEHSVSEDFRNALSGLFRNDNPNFDAYRFDQAARGTPKPKDQRELPSVGPAYGAPHPWASRYGG